MKITTIFLTVALVSCSSMTPLSKTTLVSNSRILSVPPGAAESLDDGAKIVVIRDKGFIGSGIKYTVYVDGTAVAKLKPGERYETYLTDGERVFGVTTTKAFTVKGFFGGRDISETTVLLKKGEICYLRIVTGGAMGSKIQRTAVYQ